MENIVLLESLKTQIEKLEKEQQIEILKILNNNPEVKLNENKSGVFINLPFLTKSAINDIKKHLDYIKDQEQTLKFAESQKQTYAKTYFEHEASA